MKHVTKLMVVPYVPRIESQSEKFLHDLNNERESVFNNKKLNSSEKLKLYSQASFKYKDNLERFKSEEEPKSFIDILSTEIVDKTYNKIKPELEELKVKSRLNNTNKNKVIQIKNENSNNLTDNESILDNTEKEINDKEENESTKNEQIDNFKENDLDMSLDNKPDSQIISIPEPNLTENLVNNFQNIISIPNFEFIKQTHKGMEYIVPSDMTDSDYRYLHEDAPNGIDYPKFLEYFSTSGSTLVNQAFARKTYKMKGAREKYLEIMINFKKEQKGSGIKKWKTKRFF